MSNRRISTRRSRLSRKNSDVIETDEGGFNALQNSNFVLTSSKGFESTNSLSFRETDGSEISVPKDWGRRLRDSSIGLADNNKENDTKKSTRNSDLETEDLSIFVKKNLHRRRHLQANYVTSSSDTENEFEKILSGKIKASQPVDVRDDDDDADDDDNDASSPERSEKIHSVKDIELQRKNIPRRKIALNKLMSPANESDKDFEKILSSQIKSSQQELTQNAAVDEQHDSTASDQRKSSVESNDIATDMEARSSCRYDKTWRSHQSSCIEKDNNDLSQSSTLKESIIYHKHDSSSEVEQHSARDNQKDCSLRENEQNEISPTSIDDLSIHPSDQSSRSSFLQKANANNMRKYYTSTSMNNNIQSDLKETSSISILESDRESSSAVGSVSDFSNVSCSKIATKISTGKKSDNKDSTLSLSERNSGRSLALIELELNKNRSKTKQQINPDQQAGQEFDIHDAETESEPLKSKNTPKRKKAHEENSVILDKSVAKTMKTMSTSKLLQPCCIRLDRILDGNEKFSQSLSIDLEQLEEDRTHNQTPITHSANTLGSTKKKQDKTLTSKSPESKSKEKSKSKHSQTRRQISSSFDSKNEDIDQSRKATTSLRAPEKKSVAESRTSSLSKRGDSGKKLTQASYDSENEDIDQSRKETTSLKASEKKSVAESRTSLISKRGDSRKKLTQVSYDSKNEDVDQSRRATTSLRASEKKSVAENGTSSLSKRGDSEKKLTQASYDSENENLDQSQRATTLLGVSEAKSVAESGTSSLSKHSDSFRKKFTVVNSDSEDEDVDQSQRSKTLLGISKAKSVAESGTSSLSRRSDSSRKKFIVLNSDSENEEIDLSLRRSTPGRVTKPKNIAESGNTSLSTMNNSKQQMALFRSDSENEDADQSRQVPISISKSTNILESSMPKPSSSRKRNSNHEIDEEEISIAVPAKNPVAEKSPAKKSKRNDPVPAENAIFSSLASTSYHQSQLNKLKQTAKSKVPLKPVQPTLDGFLKRVKKLPPSELGLKYKSLQDFDKQHNQSELSKELLELRQKLLKDPYIMQETNRIIRETWNDEEEQRKKKEQARLVKEKQKMKKQKLETAKKTTEQRKLRKQEQLAKISDDYKVKGKVYKPRLAKPKKWCTSRLYENLQKKMEPIYGIETRLRSEKLMLNMVKAVDHITKTAKYDDYEECLNRLKRQLAMNGIVVTHDDFWLFAYEYLPYSFRVKAVPMTLPGNVETIPDWDPANDSKPILETS